MSMEHWVIRIEIYAAVVAPQHHQSNIIVESPVHFDRWTIVVTLYQDDVIPLIDIIIPQ